MKTLVATIATEPIVYSDETATLGLELDGEFVTGRAYGEVAVLLDGLPVGSELMFNGLKGLDSVMIHNIHSANEQDLY